MTQTATRPQLVVRRHISASPTELFDAWLDEKALSVWMCPTVHGFTHAEVTVDARVGGAFSINMIAPNRSHLHTGAYRVIDRPNRLVFTWFSDATKQTETLVTVDFVATATGTEIVLTHDQLADDTAVKNHNEGWSAILDVVVEAYGQKNNKLRAGSE